MSHSSPITHSQAILTEQVAILAASDPGDSSIGVLERPGGPDIPVALTLGKVDKPTTNTVIHDLEMAFSELTETAKTRPDRTGCSSNVGHTL